MDSHKEKDSVESKSTPDTSHLAASKRSKRSNKKVIIILAAVVVVVAALVGGGLYYKKVQDDKKAADAAAAAAAADKKKPLSQEEQIAAQLTDSVKRQLDALKQDDPQATIKNDTAAAQRVGRDLHETDLKD